MVHPFAHRLDAARQLADRLLPFSPGWRQPIVLALVRGGVPVGASVAQILHCAWEPLLVRKLGVLGQPEVAEGAMGLGMDSQGNWAVVQVSNAMLHSGAAGKHEALKAREHERYEELMELRRRYALPERPPSLLGRTAVLVDDGVATGCSLRAGIAVARSRHCQEVVVAVPVAPLDVWTALCRLVDSGVCLVAARSFTSVSSFYSQFPDVQDDEVHQWLHA